MQAILDFSQELDVPTLDRVVQVMYTTAGAEVGNHSILSNDDSLRILCSLVPLSYVNSNKRLNVP